MKIKGHEIFYQDDFWCNANHTCFLELLQRHFLSILLNFRVISYLQWTIRMFKHEFFLTRIFLYSVLTWALFTQRNIASSLEIPLNHYRLISFDNGIFKTLFLLKSLAFVNINHTILSLKPLVKISLCKRKLYFCNQIELKLQLTTK